MQRSIQRYGWVPSLPDFRNFKYRDMHSPMAMMLKGGVVAPLDPNSVHNVINTPHASTALGPDGMPLTVSLRDKMPPVFDQGQLGSCTAQAACAMFAYLHNNSEMFSRLWLYYEERLIEGNVSFDSGAQVKDAISVLAKFGCPSEDSWPYDVTKFAIEPPAADSEEATKHKAVEYSQLETEQDIKHSLVQGYPVIFGMSVYSSFESNIVAQTALVPMPTYNDSLMGGHCMLIIGYTVINGQPYFEVRNSWNTTWGADGYCFIPSTYISNKDLCSDFWTVRAVS